MRAPDLKSFAATLKESLETLSGEKKVLCAAHVSPDPDAIGSSFASAYLLRGLGAKPSVFFPEALPKKYIPLVGDIPVLHSAENSGASMLFVVDTATEQRVGLELHARRSDFQTCFNLDHHVSNNGWGDVSFVDGKASASALLVWRLFRELQIPIDRRVSNLLYSGLLDDTGSFCFSNTNAESFACAADLMSSGASPEDVANAIYFSVPERVFRLQSRAIQAMRPVLGGKAMLMAVSRKDLEETGCTAEETEGLVDIARRVEGTDAAIFMRELDGKWKLSLRSKTPWLDVNPIAGVFGGGGHAAAAGCTIEGTREFIEARILEEFSRVFSAAESSKK